LKDRLARDGIRVQESRKIPFSLEDVFLHLLHRNQAGGTRSE
jgi:hypothetical protein